MTDKFAKHIDPYIITVLIPLFVIFLSVYIHGVLGEYSDILSISLDKSRGKDPLYGIPYIDFRFEYPPVVAGAWGLASILTKILYFYDPVKLHMYILFFINGVFYLIYVHAIYDLYNHYVKSSRLGVILSIASPSMIYYLMYNWDIIATSFAILSYLYFFRGRYKTGGFLLALSVLAKIFTGVLVLSIIYLAYLLRYKDLDIDKKMAETLILFILIILIPTSFVMIYSPNSFEMFLRHHGEWYCENCFYIMFTQDLWDPFLRNLSKTLMIIMPLTVFLIVVSRGYRDDVYKKVLGSGFISLATLISFSYVYSPQMNIMIAPLYMILNIKEIFILLLGDIFNIMIMIFWFRTEIFTKIGLPSADPHVRESPIQWFAFIRIVLLWIIIISYLYRSYRKT
ncbi:MAG: hypothetical protein LM581_03980 [Desulfurococcales archaeon]|nr:hypothetical protein [Desulfurococcales archaeon]